MAEVRARDFSHLQFGVLIFILSSVGEDIQSMDTCIQMLRAQGKNHFLAEGTPAPEPHVKVKHEKARRRVHKHLALTDTYAVRQMTREAVIA